MKSPKLSSARGFTLIEILVVVALVGLIGAMSTIIGFDTLSRSNVHEERDLIVTLLTGQRAKALANVDETEHTFEIVGDHYEVDGREIERDTSVDLDGDTEVVFKQLSGDAPDCPCSIEVKQEDKSQTITVEENGRIEW